MLKFIISLLVSFFFIQLNLTSPAFAGASVLIGGDSTHAGDCDEKGETGICSYTFNHGEKNYGGAHFRLFRANSDTITHHGFPRAYYKYLDKDGIPHEYDKDSVISTATVYGCLTNGGYYFANVFDSVGHWDQYASYVRGAPVGLVSIINFDPAWMSYGKRLLGNDVNTPTGAALSYNARDPLDLNDLGIDANQEFTQESVEKLRRVAEKEIYAVNKVSGKIVTFDVASIIFDKMKQYAKENPDDPKIDPKIRRMGKITDLLAEKVPGKEKPVYKGVAAFCFDPGKIVAKKASFYSNSYARIEVNGHSDSGAYGHGSSKGKEFGSIQKTIIEDNKDKIQIIISHDLGVEGANVSGRKTNYKIKNTFRSSNANKDQSVILQDSYPQGSYIPTKSPETKRVLDSQKVFRQPTVFSLPSKLAPGEYTVISEITFDNVDKNDAPEPKKKSSVQAKIIIKPTPVYTYGCPESAPPNYYSSDINKGYTYGASFVMNRSSYKKWEGGKSWGKTNGDVVWAKPSDSIQFTHCYFSGVGKPIMSNRHGARNVWYNTSHGARDMHFASNTFSISASPNSKYFFGNDSSSGGGNGEKITNSPSQGNRSYLCDKHPSGEPFQGGYQVPGNNYSNNCHNVSSSDLGQTITQTLRIDGPQSAIVEQQHPGSWCMEYDWVDYDCPPCYNKSYIDEKGKKHTYRECSTCSKWDCVARYHHTNNPYYLGTTRGNVPSTTATVKIPYNYDTKTTSSIFNNPVVYPGESMSGDLSVKITKRDNPDVSATPYATMSFDSRVINIKFLVSPSVYDKDRIVKGGISTSDPCSYFRGKSGVTGCSEISNHSTRLNPEGNLNGKTHSYSFDQAVPDVEVGTKFCVATGVYPADSHDRPDQTLGSNANNSAGMQNNSNKWRISNASCRTISKKPNFQVFGAGVYSSGNIKTSLSHKHLHAGISTSSHNPQHLFGSWAEHYVISNGTIKGFGSGASLGYSGQGYKIPGGSNRSPSDHCQNLSPLSVANDSCPSGPGDSRINVDSPVLERLLARYLIPKTTFDSATAIPDCPSGLKCVSIANGATYAKPNSGSIDSAIIRQVGSTTKNNTLIIHHEGTLNINSNITYQNGIYSNIASLPQVIIVADNINISSNVTSLDAWLIARSASGEYGKINTCSDFRESITDANSCNKRLYINGPVFAKKLSLNRTGGAGSGHASIEPAEVFDLRPDTYLWGYNQAQRYSQATVTYQKEVAPRY